MSSSTFKYIKSSEDFYRNIIESNNKLILLDFYADYCGPCKRMDPKLHEMCEKRGVQVLKVNVDEPLSAKMVSEFQVRSMPTFCLFKKMRCIAKVEGAKEKELEELLTKHRF